MRVLLLAAIALSVATAASAQAVAPQTSSAIDRAVIPGQAEVMSVRPAVKLSPTLSYARTGDLGPSGFAKTSVSHKFDPDGVTGSLGFLCGIKPFAPDSYNAGGGPTSGFDHGLTFLGAQVGIAFH